MLMFHFYFLITNFTVEFKTCCNYPDLVLLEADSIYCSRNCSDSCCDLVCCFEKMGFIANGEIQPTGLVSAFSAPVGYDTAWTYIIESSVKRCYDDVPITGEFMCKVIPKNYLDIIDCTFLQNFALCPNPTDSEVCHLAKTLVEKCMSIFMSSGGGGSDYYSY